MSEYRFICFLLLGIWSDNLDNILVFHISNHDSFLGLINLFFVWGIDLIDFFLEFTAFGLEMFALLELSIHFTDHSNVVVQTYNCQFIVIQFSPHVLVLVFHFLETFHLLVHRFFKDFFSFSIEVESIESLHFH